VEPLPPEPAAAPPEPDEELDPDPPEPDAPDEPPVDPEPPEDEAPEEPDPLVVVVVAVEFVGVVEPGVELAIVPVGTVKAGAPEVSAWLVPPPPQAARPIASAAPAASAARGAAIRR
jgi:hypothetical protein